MNLNQTSAAILLLLAGLPPASGSAVAQDTPALDLDKASLSQLEARASAIDTELDELAHYSLRSGVGSIGYRSDVHLEAEHTEWGANSIGSGHPHRSNRAGALHLARHESRLQSRWLPLDNSGL